MTATAQTRPDNEVLLTKYHAFMEKLRLRFGGKCVGCGSTEDLQFDHIDWRTKEFTIASNWAMKDRLAFEAELLKCQLLCGDCHRVKTQQDISEMNLPGFTHGTYYGWADKGCSCIKCSEAREAYRVQRSESRRATDGVRGAYGLPAEHGTRKRYRRGCKCGPCRAANVAYTQSKSK